MKPQPMCIVTFGYQSFVMPAAEGAEIFLALSSAKQVEPLYSQLTPYKFGATDQGVTMKHLPWEDYEKMCQMRDAENALKE